MSVRSQDVGKNGEVVSYAQNWEDLILHVLLYGVDKGFYVDAGANSPVVDSVTQYFYLRGWRGINIEPNPKHIKEFKKNRPRDINLQLAVSDHSGEEKFREYSGEHHGLSTIANELQEDHARDKLKFRDYKVKVLPLKEVLKRYLPKGQKIDFLKIDVEGLEYEVIKGNDWKTYRPRVVVIESNHLEMDWRPMFEKLDYKKVYFDGLNDYYADVEYAKYIDFVVYPSVVTERGPVLSYQQKLRRDNLIKEFETKSSELKSDLLKEKNQADVLKRRLDIVYSHPLRFAAGRVYHYYVKRDEKRKGDDS